MYKPETWIITALVTVLVKDWVKDFKYAVRLGHDYSGNTIYFKIKKLRRREKKRTANRTNDLKCICSSVHETTLRQTDAMLRKATGRCSVREYLHSALQARATLRVTEKTKWPSHTEFSQSEAEIFITACKSFGLCLATVTRHRLAWGRVQLSLSASCRKFDSTLKP